MQRKSESMVSIVNADIILKRPFLLLPNLSPVLFKISKRVIISVPFTEERISQLDKELENANDLLAAARQRGKKHYKPTIPNGNQLIFNLTL